MRISISDFYLLRIAHLGESDSFTAGDFTAYLTRAIESRRRHIAEVEAAFMMLELMGTEHVRNRLFTWDEYEILSKSALFIEIDDEEIEADHPVVSELATFVKMLRKILEPKLRCSTAALRK